MTTFHISAIYFIFPDIDYFCSKLTPDRNRLPRCVQGPGGLLPRYNSKQSQGQQYLYMVNNKLVIKINFRIRVLLQLNFRNYKEQLVAYEVLGSAFEDLLCIVSNEIVRIVTTTRTPDITPVIECSLR